MENQPLDLFSHIWTTSQHVPEPVPLAAAPPPPPSFSRYQPPQSTLPPHFSAQPAPSPPSLSFANWTEPTNSLSSFSFSVTPDLPDEGGRVDPFATEDIFAVFRGHDWTMSSVALASGQDGFGGVAGETELGSSGDDWLARSLW